MNNIKLYTQENSQIGFGPQRKLSRFIDRKWVNITNIDPFTIDQRRDFGSVEIPIFEFSCV